MRRPLSLDEDPLKTKLLVQASGRRIQRAEPNEVLSGLSSKHLPNISRHPASAPMYRHRHAAVVRRYRRAGTGCDRYPRCPPAFSAFRDKQALPRSLETNRPAKPLVRQPKEERVAFACRTVRQSIDACGKKWLGPTRGPDFSNPGLLCHANPLGFRREGSAQATSVWHQRTCRRNKRPAQSVANYSITPGESAVVRRTT
jgi:hypothetical protein